MIGFNQPEVNFQLVILMYRKAHALVNDFHTQMAQILPCPFIHPKNKKHGEQDYSVFRGHFFSRKEKLKTHIERCEELGKLSALIKP